MLIQESTIKEPFEAISKEEKKENSIISEFDKKEDIPSFRRYKTRNVMRRLMGNFYKNNKKQKIFLIIKDYNKSNKVNNLPDKDQSDMKKNIFEELEDYQIKKSYFKYQKSFYKNSFKNERININDRSLTDKSLDFNENAYKSISHHSKSNIIKSKLIDRNFGLKKDFKEKNYREANDDLIEIPIMDIINPLGEKNTNEKKNKEKSESEYDLFNLENKKLKKDNNVNLIDTMKNDFYNDNNSSDTSLLKKKRFSAKNFSNHNINKIEYKHRGSNDLNNENNLLNSFQKDSNHHLSKSKLDSKKIEIVEGFEVELDTYMETSKEDLVNPQLSFNEKYLNLKENGFDIEEEPSISTDINSIQYLQHQINTFPEGFETDETKENIVPSINKNISEIKKPIYTCDYYTELFTEFLQSNFHLLDLGNNHHQESFETILNKFVHFIYSFTNDQEGMDQLDIIDSTNNYNLFFQNFLQMNNISFIDTNRMKYQQHGNLNNLIEDEYNPINNYTKSFNGFYGYNIKNDIGSNSNDYYNIPNIDNNNFFKKEINMINIKQNFITSNYQMMQSIENPIYNNNLNSNFINYYNNNYNNNTNNNYQNSFNGYPNLNYYDNVKNQLIPNQNRFGRFNENSYFDISNIGKENYKSNQDKNSNCQTKNSHHQQMSNNYYN